MAESGPERAVLVSVVTPFRDDERIDFTAWQRNLEMLAANGIAGFVALGEEGEFRTLSEEERMVALRFCRQTLGRGARLYGNVGSDSTSESIRLAQTAEADGVDWIVVLPPRQDLSPEELAEHLAEIRAAVRTPVASLAELTVSAAANVAPRLALERERAHATGRLEDAARLQGLLDPLDQAFQLHTYPSMVKEAMRRSGFPSGACRRPVGLAPAPAAERLERVLQALRAANWLPEPASRSSAGHAA
ncbi:MAG: dihydrodipicolinate synthase family protein [Acidobacteria bacterium]|nr:dihydrodipicolinate synthase family protein [Acidobacteriota bacterium]